MTTEIKKELIDSLNDDNETDNSGQNDNVDVKQEEINNNAKIHYKILKKIIKIMMNTL